MLILITYDLKSDKDYHSLHETIKGCSTTNKWWHYMESVWIICTDMSVNECNDIIRRQMDNNDLLFIVEITDMTYQGWLPSKAWEWLDRNKS